MLLNEATPIIAAKMILFIICVFYIRYIPNDVPSEGKLGECSINAVNVPTNKVDVPTEGIIVSHLIFIAERHFCLISAKSLHICPINQYL